MICGRRLSMRSLSLALLLLLFSATYSYSAEGQADCSPVYEGPELPEGWHPIATCELTELENIQTRQENRLSTLESLLDRQATTISELRTSLTTLSGTISELRGSWTEYVDAVEARQTELRRERWLWGGVGVIAGAGVAGIIMVFR